MFRRPWSALPPDADFPADLNKLGYFINSEDEIRKIDDSNYYFNYHIDMNERVNFRQRFAFDQTIRTIIHERIEKEGLRKLNLPPGASSTEPHVPVFVTPDLDKYSRIVVIFGEPSNHLGLLASRVVGGPGGINNGSVVALIQEVKQDASVGFVLANMGELYWWPEEKRAISVKDSTSLKLPSLAHRGTKYHPSINDIPCNAYPDNHLHSVFQDIIKPAINGGTKLDILAIGHSCEVLQNFLNEETNWDQWANSLNAMVLFGPDYPVEYLQNDKLISFMKERCRAYVCSWHSQDTPVADVDGNEAQQIHALGVQCFSGGEPHFVELLAINCVESAAKFLQEFHGDASFKNPPITVPEEEPAPSYEEQDGWLGVSDADRPFIDKLDPGVLEEQVKQSRRWQKYVETGVAADSDVDTESHTASASESGEVTQQ